MLPHSTRTAHANPSLPDADVLCLPSSPTYPNTPASTGSPVAQSSSPSASPNDSDTSTGTTIGPAASAATPGHPRDTARAGTEERSLRSRQRNRLQLRNAGFRAPPLTNRRVSPFSIFSQSRETSPSATLTAQDTKYSGGLYSESTILQEVHKSTRRKYTQSGRPSLHGVFQEREQRPESGSTTFFTRSPTDMSPRTEYLKRPSENDENVPPSHSSERGSSPIDNIAASLRGSRSRLTGSHRINRPKSGKYRSSSLQVTAYIDSLESEIASLETRLTTLNSPSMTSVQSSKLRSLTAENRNLKQDIVDWEAKFEERVKDSVYERTHFEADLQRRIRELEDEIRNRDERCFVLETQVKEAERRVQDAEECEKNMSKRVDVLSSMVAGSPNKGVGGWATAPTTPMMKDFPDPLRPAQRVKSMLAPHRRVVKPSRPFSPSRRETITSAEDVFGWHAAEDGVGHPLEASPQEDMIASDTGKTGLEDSSIYSTSHSDGQSVLTASTQPTNLDITELRSPTRERPMSLLSTSSFSASWGLPASLGRSYTDGPGSASMFGKDCKRPSQAKRTRRFHSSAGGLKPLILPSTASSSSNSLTSPRRESLLSPSRLGSVSELLVNSNNSNNSPCSVPNENADRDHFSAYNRTASGLTQQSNSSFDPTTAFWERSREASPDDPPETPTIAVRRRSKEMKEMRAREIERLRALRQLEGDFTCSIDQMIADMTATQIHDEALENSCDVDYSTSEQNLTLDTPSSTLADELQSSRALSFNSTLSSSRAGSKSIRSPSYHNEQGDGWADDMISAPSTPSRSPSPALTEMPRGTIGERRGAVRANRASGFYGTLPQPTVDGPILQAPRISITQGTASHASSESIATEVPENDRCASETSDHRGLFERLTKLATAMLPFKASSAQDPGVQNAKRILTVSKPVLLARRILQHSWSHTAEGIGVLSPFRLGGLGWWLFGLFNTRFKQARQSSGTPLPGDHIEPITRKGMKRPRKVSIASEERQIGLPSNEEDEYEFSPEQLRRLELDGPGECTMMRAEPHIYWNEQSAMLGLPHLSPSRRIRSYGSVNSSSEWPSIEGRANSAVDRVFGKSHMTCSQCQEPATRRRLRAWAKFGLALVLAVGVAIIEGPEAAMGDEVEHASSCRRAKRDSEDWRDETEEVATRQPLLPTT